MKKKIKLPRIPLALHSHAHSPATLYSRGASKAELENEIFQMEIDKEKDQKMLEFLNDHYGG